MAINNIFLSIKNISIPNLTSEIGSLLKSMEGVLGVYPGHKGVHILFNMEQAEADNIIEIVMKAGYTLTTFYIANVLTANFSEV